MNKKTLLLLLGLFATIATVSGQIITTIAGGGTAGLGDGGPAADCELRGPCGVATDAAGNIYVCDRDQHRVRKISTSGIITTIAGTGLAGYSGDGGSADVAQLNKPYCIALDGMNNIYIGDGNATIRKITPSGVISTIAGTGVPGYSGDGGPATAAMLNGASSIVIDGSGNIIIADIYNERIRKISPTGIITTIAGSGDQGFGGDGGAATTAKFFWPTGVCVDISGNIFVVDSKNQRIRKINTAGIITTIAGTGTAGYSGDGGMATSAKFRNPIGIAADAESNLYITDVYNYRLRRIDHNSGVITTIAGAGLPNAAGDGGPAILANLNTPVGVCLNAAGNIIIGDFGNDKVRFINSVTAVAAAPPDNVTTLALWPVPSKGDLNVYVPSKSFSFATIIISSVSGQEVARIEATTNKTIPIALSVPPGVYLVSAVTQETVLTERVVIAGN